VRQGDWGGRRWVLSVGGLQLGAVVKEKENIVWEGGVSRGFRMEGMDEEGRSRKRFEAVNEEVHSQDQTTKKMR